jgi:DNA-binding CsgD family transcriptional regulator
MRSWHLDHPDLAGHLEIVRATSLMSAIGDSDTNAFAAEVLRLLSEIPAISQCTVFAYELGRRPHIMSVADYRGGHYLRDVSEAYSARFHRLDNNQGLISSPVGAKPDSILLHHQTIDDIPNDAYRAICYREPNVSDRLSFMLQPSKDVWLAVNLYCDRSSPFQESTIKRIEALGPLIAHAAKYYYALHALPETDISHLMLRRIRAFCPDLSKRELDVIRGVLEGRTAHDIGDMMGIKSSSVITYQKRAYRRLGISSQRELFAMCLALPKG